MDQWSLPPSDLAVAGQASESLVLFGLSRPPPAALLPILLLFNDELDEVVDGQLFSSSCELDVVAGVV